MNIFLSKNLSGSKQPKNQSILVIDDSTDALAVQQILLGQAGYDVYTAESGKEGFRVLFEIDEPDLILLDMQLGDMDGIEFLGLLEKEHPQIIRRVPVVFLTGMEDIPESKAIGVIRKPEDMDQILKAVRHFIEMGQRAPYKH